MSKRVVIIGGGLAGLSAAYHLKVPYLLIEKEAVTGGVASSQRINGFTFDHAIHILYTKDPYASAFIHKMLGENICRATRSSWIYSHARYTPYPYQANNYGLPAATIAENLYGLIESQYGPKKEIHSFEDWIIATFGKGIAKNFMIPFNRKVWACEPREMSHEWISERVPVPSLEQAFKGAFTESPIAYGTNAEFWYPKQGGTAALAQAIANRVSNIQKTAECIAIDIHTKTISLSTAGQLPYDYLISTVPLPRLVHMIGGAPTSIQEAAGRLRSNKVITVNLGIQGTDVSEKHWVYFPEASVPFQRVSFPHNFSTDLVPAGCSSIMAEISMKQEAMYDKNSIVQQVIDSLRTLNILRSHHKILVKQVLEIDPAYVIYDKQHRKAVDIIQYYLRQLGIYSCGRFGAWEYFNMDQAILSGKEAAEHVMANIQYN